MRSAVDILARACSAIVGIRHLRQAAGQVNMAGDFDGCLGFHSVSPAGTFELEGPVVGYVDHLVRAVDPEAVEGEGEAADARGDSCLVEVGGGDALRFG